MMALATMMGTTNFLRKIYSKWNLPYALAYTVSLVLGIYYSTNGGNYLIVLGLCVLQVSFFWLKSIVRQSELFVVCEFAVWETDS